MILIFQQMERRMCFVSVDNFLLFLSNVIIVRRVDVEILYYVENIKKNKKKKTPNEWRTYLQSKETFVTQVFL